MKSIKNCRLYGILDTAYLGRRNPSMVAARMVEGGVDILQLRAKTSSAEEIIGMAEGVLKITRPAKIPFIINDHPGIAAKVGADGVHVGQDDMSVAKARQILGGKGMVGKSTHSLEQALEAEKEKPDYIGVGPIFATPTKPDYSPVGLGLIGKVAEKVKIPFFCIGGVKLGNAPEVIASGSGRIVVVSGILQAEDIGDYCRRLKTLLD